MAKDREYNRLIQSRRWRKLRAEHLRASPWCVRCLEEGVRTPATQVHHVRPVESVPTCDRERVAFDSYNLMSLCAECHRAEHQRAMSPVKEREQRRNEILNRMFDECFTDTPPNFLKQGIGGVNPTSPQIYTRGENFQAVGDFEK